MNTNEKILGGLFGVACGDALGGTLEFMTKDEVVGKYGYHRDIIGGGCWKLEPGEVTDDTMMTIAVAEGILAKPENPIEEIGKRFIEWYDSKPKDIGNIIRIALEEYKRSGDWMRTAYYAHQATGGMSAGNGSLMRCIPIALFYKDLGSIIQITGAQSILTHYDNEATTACVLYNKLTYFFLNGGQKIPVIRQILEDYPSYKQVFKMSKDSLNPSGYVVDTLICSLWCFINTASFEAAVCEAVNLGGDTDTIGAIVGGLAGVYYGYEAIPVRWKDKILLGVRIKEIARKFTD